MATNVSQQDETLHKVIEWCEQREVEGLRLANALLQKHDLAAYAVVKAQIDAYHNRRTLPFHARLQRFHAFRGTQSKRGREGIVMWFKRKYNEYGCPMCGRLPVIKAWQTEKYHESRKVRTTLTVYRLQCPRGHISTSWFSHAALASRQWKELVDEYKGKDTK